MKFKSSKKVNPQENSAEETGGVSRRKSLKAGATMGAAMCVPSIITNAAGSNSLIGGTNNTSATSADINLPFITKMRTLGTGRAAFEVSALGFDVMGMNYNRGPHPDKKAMIRLLHQAVDHGVTLFDTAEVYGPFINEELVGEALSPYKGKINVTTKFGHDIVNGKGTGKVNSRPEHVKKVAEESLRRLKIDSIPMFYQHRYDQSVPIEDVAGAISDLIKEGKVQRWELCEASQEIIRRAHAALPLTAIQSKYHLMWRLQEEQVLPLLEQLGIGFVPFSNAEWQELECEVFAIPIVGDRYNVEEQKKVNN